jgi:hypothetical protein
VVAFDGRVVKFKKVFDPLPGFTNFDALNTIYWMTTNKSLSINDVRKNIVEKLPQYDGLVDNKVEVFFLGER